MRVPGPKRKSNRRQDDGEAGSAVMLGARCRVIARPPSILPTRNDLGGRCIDLDIAIPRREIYRRTGKRGLFAARSGFSTGGADAATCPHSGVIRQRASCCAWEWHGDREPTAEGCSRAQQQRASARPVRPFCAADGSTGLSTSSAKPSRHPRVSGDGHGPRDLFREPQIL